MNDEKFWLDTISYNRFEFPVPKLKSIDPLDIGHALGMMCRFNGHIPYHYSVAEHSLHVSRLVESMLLEHNTKVMIRAPSYLGLCEWGPDDLLSVEEINNLSLAAHLHDASEFSVADLISPVKRYLRYIGELGYSNLELSIMGRIMQRFGLPEDLWLHEIVQQADQMMFATERAILRPNYPAHLQARPLKYDPMPNYDLGLGQEAAKQAWTRRFWMLYATPDDLSFLEEA